MSSERLNNSTLCPFLGTITEEGQSAPCVDYPSIENLCFVGSIPEAVMLPDQATFCLSSGHRHCPRLHEEIGDKRAQEAIRSEDTSGNEDQLVDYSDPVQHAIAEMDAALQARHRARKQRSRRWGWIGVVALFVSIIVCGGSFAAYIGWRFVSADTFASQGGSVTTLAAAATLAPAPVYVVITATSVGDSANSRDIVPAQDASGITAPRLYPAAVTATPVPSSAQNPQANPGQAQSSIPVQAAPAGQLETPRQPPNVLVQVPTRRPTPILDLNIVVPEAPTATQLPTLAPTPPLGTPVVIFAAEDEALRSGQCTTVSWHVENVSAVYYENLGVDGHGQHKECVRDDEGEYTLTIVLPTGATQYYTVTVGLLVPTQTPTPTATYAPVAPPTATWTPVVPTDTPTPDMQYGVRLTVDGGRRQTCAAGKTCRLDLRVTNTSLGLDDISVVVEETGNWTARLCRLDGVCSDSRLTIASVGPGNTALVLFKVVLPNGGAGKTMTYALRAVSEGSGGSAGTNTLSIEITGE